MGEFFRGMGANRNIGVGRNRGRLNPAFASSKGASSIVQFISTYINFTGNLIISGKTLDSSGNPLANCIVELERTSDGARIAITTSGGSGDYSFIGIASGITYQVNAYLSGSPDQAGLTVNTLTGA